MKVIGGTFGNDGRVQWNQAGGLSIRAQKAGNYKADAVSSVEARKDSKRQFGVGSFIMGAVILGGVGFVLLNVVGLLIGVALAVAGSFYSDKSEYAVISFKDGQRVEVECTARQVKRLYTLT